MSAHDLLLPLVAADETTEWEKYYYAGSVRLAIPLHGPSGDFVREDSDSALYLITNHLGSTLLVIDTSGQEVTKRYYLPFGDSLSGNPPHQAYARVRENPAPGGFSATELPTDFTFTGQREAAEIGLKYYVARWYDSEIGHFLQPDTIVPNSSSPMSWNRYAYVNYNPLKYTDPDGHIGLLVLAPIVVGVGLVAGAIDTAIQYNNTGEVDFAQSLTVAAIAAGGTALGAGVLALTGVATVTAGATAVAATKTATTVGTAVMADGDPRNEVNAIADTVNSACGGDYCASEAQQLASNTTTAKQSYYPQNLGFSTTPKVTTLLPGEFVDRFGSTYGSFLSPAGTPIWARSLPPGVTNLPLNTYEVIKPIENVLSGTIAPYFGQIGGGIQYYVGSTLGQNVQTLIDSGFLSPIIKLRIVMKKLIQKQKMKEFNNYPISNISEGWFFRVDEISQGYYRVEGVDRFGRVVSKEGINPELLLEECKKYLQEVEETE